MKKNQIFGIIVAVAAIIIVFNFVCDSSGKKVKTGSGYIHDSSDGIKFEEAFESVDFRNISFDDPEVTRDYFSRSVVNRNTVRLFKHLQHKFKEFETLEEHFDAVKTYLYSIMDPDEADELLAVYRQYVEYEIEAADMMSQLPYPKSAEEALSYMQKLQEFRRETFGKDVADAMFGHEFKMREYQIRRGGIIEDSDLYAAEKKEKLAELHKDMWGVDGDGASILRPYERYQETRRLYSRDMSEMTPEEQKAAQREIREEIFPPEVVERFEEIDNIIAEEQQREEQYRAKEQEILSDHSLTEEQRQETIRQLQDEVFGEEAEAYRRIQAIEEGRREMEENR